MIIVDMGVAGTNDNFSWLQITLLRQHQGEQRQAGSVIRQAQKGVAGANHQLRRQPSLCHIKLIQQMAGRQRHTTGLHILLRTHALIGQEFDIPSVKQNATTVRIIAQAIDHIVDLIDCTAITSRPRGPLGTIDRPKLTLLGGPRVPDRDAILLQPTGIRIPAQKPKKLVNDALKVQFLGCQ